MLIGSPTRFFKELAPLFYCDCHIFASWADIHFFGFLNIIVTGLKFTFFIIIIETILIALCHESLVTDKNIKIKKILTFVT